MLSRRLSRRGFEILLAADGAQGVKMSQEHLPDLVLMDLSLPVLDGWQATEQIKKTSETKHIPVIALTAHALPEDRERAIAAGCDDYATKPIDIDSLLSKIDVFLQRVE